MPGPRAMRRALPLCALLASCGTIMNGGPFMVPVSSSPQGATVYYRRGAVGTTPCQVAMEPSDTELRFILDGHVMATIEVETGPNWWIVGNALFLLPGLIGLGIDLGNDAHRIVSTENVKVSLTPQRR